MSFRHTVGLYRACLPHLGQQHNVIYVHPYQTHCHPMYIQQSSELSTSFPHIYALYKMFQLIWKELN